MQVTRRGLIAGAAAGGGLIIAWGLYPRSYPNPLDAGRGEYIFGSWLKIALDGVVTVAVPQLEMGQGISTILPQIVAAELGADWRQIAVEPAPPSGNYANVPLAAQWAALWMPIMPELASSADSFAAERFARAQRFNATGLGTSLAAYERPAREAAASARWMLTRVAAKRWGAAPEECIAQSGFVTFAEQRASFAELVGEAAALDPPDPAPLSAEPVYEQPALGEAEAATDYPRIDVPSKVDGSHIFAGDVRLPDMVYAAIRHAPQPGGELAGFDVDAVRGRPEIVDVIEGGDWLAAAATNWWAADRALDAMRPRFTIRGAADSDVIEDELDAALRGGTGTRIESRIADGADDDTAFADPDLALRYDIAPAPHNTLETTTATARFADGRLELWMASQMPELAREAAAKVLGLSLGDVILYPVSAGGSFDRRLENEHAIEAALIARVVGRPVQLIWSRTQEILTAPPRSAAKILMTARLAPGGSGDITALKTRIAAPPTMFEFGQRAFDHRTKRAAIAQSAGMADPAVCAGGMPHYAVPSAAIEHIPARIPLPTARMRGGAHGYTAFAMESFIDEIARRHSREPLSFRIAMLGGDLRMVECLRRAARIGEWDGGGDGSGRGIACHMMTGVGPGDGNADGAAQGRIACVAKASLVGGWPVAESLHAAVDIGRIVNLDIARQQIEGGLIYGLGLALGSALTYRGGLPRPATLGAMALPRVASSPAITVDFIASDAEPFDPGELGVTVAAPAIANALNSATGRRFRSLPLIAGGPPSAAQIMGDENSDPEPQEPDSIPEDEDSGTIGDDQSGGSPDANSDESAI